MSLNIKNERVHALAREAASRTGKSQTAVIAEALERLIAELPYEREERRSRVMAWFESLPPVTPEQRRAVRRSEAEMYDEETGLPR